MQFRVLWNERDEKVISNIRTKTISWCGVVTGDLAVAMAKNCDQLLHDLKIVGTNGKAPPNKNKKSAEENLEKVSKSAAAGQWVTFCANWQALFSELTCNFDCKPTSILTSPVSDLRDFKLKVLNISDWKYHRLRHAIRL